MNSWNKGLITIVIVLVLSTASFSYLYFQIKQKNDSIEEKIKDQYARILYEQSKQLLYLITYINAANEPEPVAVSEMVSNVLQRRMETDAYYQFIRNYRYTEEESKMLSSIYETNFELSGFLSRLPKYYETREPFEPACDKSKNISFSTDEEVMQELYNYEELYSFQLDHDNLENTALAHYHSLLESWDTNHELLCSNR